MEMRNLILTATLFLCAGVSGWVRGAASADADTKLVW